MNATGRLLAAFGALGLFLSALLPWSNVANGEQSPLDLRSQWAFGFGGQRTTDVWLESVLFILVAASILIVIGAITGSTPVTVIGAIVGGACVVAWLLQLASISSTTGTAVLQVAGPGVAAAAVGSFLALIAGVFLRMPRQQPALVD